MRESVHSKLWSRFTLRRKLTDGLSQSKGNLSGANVSEDAQKKKIEFKSGNNLINQTIDVSCEHSVTQERCIRECK